MIRQKLFFENRTKPLFIFVCIISFTLVFYVDLISPLGIAGGVPYIIVMTLCLWTKKVNHVVVLGITSAVLTIVGYFLSEKLVELWIVLLNRIYALLGILVVSFLLIKLFLLLNKAVSLSETDTLTGLKNRFYLYEQSALLISIYDRKNIPLSLIFIDLDDFKKVNDTYGHHVGDLFLKQVGDGLIKGCRKTDIIARIGGDEFVVLMPHTGMDEALFFTKKLSYFLHEYCELKEYPNISFSASFGVSSTMQEDGVKVTSVEDLLIHADAVLYKAKNQL